MTNDLNLTTRSLTADEQSRSSISLMRRFAPEMAAGMAADHNAWEMAQSPDFLMQDWAGLTRISTMTLREAVALACGIKKSYAQAIGHQVGEGAARSALNDARDVLEFIRTKKKKKPDEKVSLAWVSKVMRNEAMTLPTGFPGGAEASPEPIPAAVQPTLAGAAAPVATETRVQRQDRRLQACIDYGLPMDTKEALLRLPYGVGEVADQEGVTRQAFSTDVKAALNRRGIAKKEGAIIHRA